jgi:glycosyltransferase involved in cell wall biosynthesis
MNNNMVSVILPVYNGQLYVGESIESILKQTYKNIELIIINDGSTDESESIIKKYKDPRIVYISQKNQGLSASLNNGVRIAKGEYLARQDQDDISHPKRIEMQLNEMINKNIGLIGSRSLIINEKGKIIGKHNHPLTHEAIKLFLLFDNPFVHSSVMYKRNLILNNLYSEDKFRQPPEDYELWIRLAEITKMANLPERLLTYRQLSSGMSMNNKEIFITRIINIGSEKINALFPVIKYNDSLTLCMLYHNKIKNKKINLISMLKMHLFITRYITKYAKDKEYIKIYIYQLNKIFKSYIKA